MIAGQNKLKYIKLSSDFLAANGELRATHEGPGSSSHGYLFVYKKQGEFVVVSKTYQVTAAKFDKLGKTVELDENNQFIWKDEEKNRSWKFTLTLDGYLTWEEVNQ